MDEDRFSGLDAAELDHGVIGGEERNRYGGSGDRTDRVRQPGDTGARNDGMGGERR
ncbi:hypothetical protein D3C86_2196100 [compost metagenome]